jgi:short-subunit dehydrogenase
VEAAAFPADLNAIAEIPALVHAIEDHFGSIDVAIFAPVPANSGFVAANDLDAKTLQPLFNIFTIAPIEMVHSVLPGMLRRGDGAIVIVSGASAVMVEAGWSGPGPALAATRNFILSLNGECMPRGVYTGSVSIFAGIEGSEHMAEVEMDNPFDQPAAAIPWISPDTIADEILDLVTRRECAELYLPAQPAV